jgi:hypothetical protein
VETESMILGLLLGVGWGIAYAAFLQFTAIGRYIVERVTWLAVVIGVGVDLLIVGPFIGWHTMLFVAAVVGASSIGIIARSLLNYHREYVAFERMLDHAEDAE